MSGRCDGAAAELMAMAGGYQAARVVLAAVEVGVFEALAEGPRQADNLAARLGLQPGPARRLLETLSALGLLERSDGRYAVAARFAGCLMPGRPGYLGDILGHHASLWYAWSDLPRVLAAGAPLPRDGRTAAFPEERRIRCFIQGMKNLADMQMPVLLKALDLSSRRRLLDLGGGPASHSIAFCKAHPALHATVFDQPEALEWGRHNAAEAGLEDRIRFVAGDFLADPLGEGYDFVFAFSIIHSYPAEANRALLKRCAAALDRGGVLAIKEFFVTEDRSGPAWNLLFGINMLVNTEGGDVFSREEVREWMTAAGLVPEPGEVVLDERASLLLARKP